MKKLKYAFVESNGDTTTTPKGIVPLAMVNDGELSVIGTAFYISRYGILVTARHCIDEINSYGQVDGVVIFHWLDSKKYALRPIVKAWSSHHADVAVLLALPMQKKENANPLPTDTVQVSIQRPPPGTEIVTYAFPNTKKSSLPNKGTKFAFSATHIEGRILDYFPSGRDKRMITWPVYRTDLQIQSGASGGPVFSEQGSVFAVNTSSIENNDEEQPISYITPIDYILDASFDDLKLPGYAQTTWTMKELASAGFVEFEPKFPFPDHKDFK
ncbi:MAG: hypothetical protein AXW12_06285 [Thalassospira sp. Nap_22]|uniref:S1 family peptidase n=1 Tax=Thalassospira sp. TaxID=1912094 RepID=UPI000795AEB1|nr:MAG: hypothetical protein AXW12_06285 [Thalassospira sp. Nap_22]